MTLLDMAEWYETVNGKSMWNDFVLTEKINRQALIDYLMDEYADMEVIDNNSKVYYRKINNFFLVHKWNIDKLAETLEFDYNPIWNSHHFEHEKWARDETINEDTYRDDDWTEHGTTHEQDVHGVSAYNDTQGTIESPIDTEDYRDVMDVNYSKEGTDDTTTDKDTVEDEDYTGDIEKWGHDPNKTYQELIEQEREQAQFNIYKWIASHFCNEMLIAIW